MITTSQFETSLGTLTAFSVEEGICLLAFSDRVTEEKEINYLSKYFKTSIQEGVNDHLTSLRKQIDEYFAGSRKEFTVPLVTTGTQFQQSVWNGLLNIGYGKTRSYQEQSAALGMPGSVRAVANANGMNRIAILIPCHRVIGSNGSLTGYGGGLERKRWLLEHEKRYSGQEFNLTLF